MRILFLDQSGKPGGAELSLMDLAKPYGDRCLVALFEDGPFRQRLEQGNIPVTYLSAHGMNISKDSAWWQSLGSSGDLITLLRKCWRLSRDYDVLYANTSKALVVGALVSLLSGKPLVYHLRDILSLEHFSQSNLRIAVTLANARANAVIANSRATREAFIQAGGKPELCHVVYNGFDPKQYQTDPETVQQLRRELSIAPEQCVIGHFSRLSPWKGQHVLIDAITQVSSETRSCIVVLLVGSALFGEDDYVQQLHDQVEAGGLGDRVQFLGFRSDIPKLMTACDLVVHSSTSPEPFGRVIVEAMLCGTPVIAANAGGAMELVDHGQTGLLATPGDQAELAQFIQQLQGNVQLAQALGLQAQALAAERFTLNQTHRQIEQLVTELVDAAEA